MLYVTDDVMLPLGSGEYNHSQKNGCGVIQEHRRGFLLYMIISICCCGDVINHQLPYKHFFTAKCEYNVVKNTCSLILVDQRCVLFFNYLQCKDSEGTMVRLQQRGYEQLQAK